MCLCMVYNPCIYVHYVFMNVFLCLFTIVKYEWYHIYVPMYLKVFMYVVM